MPEAEGYREIEKEKFALGNAKIANGMDIPGEMLKTTRDNNYVDTEKQAQLQHYLKTKLRYLFALTGERNVLTIYEKNIEDVIIINGNLKGRNRKDAKEAYMAKTSAKEEKGIFDGVKGL